VLQAASPGTALDTLLDELATEGLPRLRKALVRDLLSWLSPRRLKALLDRHTNGTVDSRRPGVPDLFVFKRRPDRKPFAVRFVEVKRPREAVKPHQLAEIHFMRSIGLRAGVLRLIEQGRDRRAPSPAE
jgi:hypothetical protein